MVHPAGPAAAEIAWLWWVMFGAFTGVFVLVIVLLFYAIFRRSSATDSAGAERPEMRDLRLPGAEPDSSSRAASCCRSWC